MKVVILFTTFFCVKNNKFYKKVFTNSNKHDIMIMNNKNERRSKNDKSRND